MRNIYAMEYFFKGMLTCDISQNKNKKTKKTCDLKVRVFIWT